MKKSLFLLCLLSVFSLYWCNSSSKLESAQNYCDETNWVLTQEGNMFVCTYEDWSVCEAEDFSKAWCATLENIDESDLNTEDSRIAACEEKTLFLLNAGEATFEWRDEDEWWASFYRNWRVTYTKTDWTASEDVVCVIDMAEKTVDVELSNHEFEGVVFYPEDDEDTLNAKRESYVNNYVALENEKCVSEVLNINDIPYGTYKCQQLSEDEGADYYNRSWIYNIFDDEWILTCNEANWEQWAWFNQERFGAYGNDKTCEELQSYIAEKLNKN